QKSPWPWEQDCGTGGPGASLLGRKSPGPMTVSCRGSMTAWRRGSSSARCRAQPATELCEAVGPGADTNYFAELGRGAGCFAELETGAGCFAELGRGAGVKSSSACCQKASSSREAVRNTVTSS